MATIALLLSGFARNHTLDSINEYVIVPNIASGHVVDIFTSTWDTSGIIVNHDTGNPIFTGIEYWTGLLRTYDNHPLDRTAFENYLSRLGARHVSTRYHSYEQRAKVWLAALEGQGPFERGKNQHTILRKKGMWFGLADVFAMLPEPEAYDFIIRCRLDIRFQEHITVDSSGFSTWKRPQVRISDVEYDMTSIVIHKNEHIARISDRLPVQPKPVATLLVPVRDSGYIDDWFAIGTPNSMSVHMTAFDRLDQYLDIMKEWPEPYESESITVYNALSRGVALLTFPKSIYQ